MKFLLVVIDYFTKWIEAKPVAAISANRVKKFYWKIVCRFGLLGKIVSDNGTQFASKTVEKFCKGLNIQQIFSLVEHPQTNGLVEAANKVILMGLKKATGQCQREVGPGTGPGIMVVSHSTTQETPFKLVYRSDAVIPMEIGEPTIRTGAF